jgi:signal transduction histidine kinase
MDVEEARGLLRSEDPQDRLRAARALRGNVRPSDRLILEEALRHENDHYVQLAIRRALVGTSAARPPLLLESGEGRVSTSADLSEIATQLIHEFAKTLGVLEVYAKDEVRDFDSSQTSRQIDQLKVAVEQTRSLREAATPAELREVELDPLLRNLARDVRLSTGWDGFVFDGDVTAVAVASGAHIELALRNAMTNAVESSRLAKTEASIVISWGEDDREYWICVHDSGTGLAANAEELYKIGVTTKANGTSRGWGLAVAHQAAAALGGTIELSERFPCGASFKFRWSKPETLE